MTIESRFLSNHTIKTSCKTIGSEFVKSEEDTRKIAEGRGYKDFNVDLLSFTKIGFRKYFVVWKVTGRREVIDP